MGQFLAGGLPSPVTPLEPDIIPPDDSGDGGYIYNRTLKYEAGINYEGAAGNISYTTGSTRPWTNYALSGNAWIGGRVRVSTTYYHYQFPVTVDNTGGALVIIPDVVSVDTTASMNGTDVNGRLDIVDFSPIDNTILVRPTYNFLFTINSNDDLAGTLANIGMMTSLTGVTSVANYTLLQEFKLLYK